VTDWSLAPAHAIAAAVRDGKVTARAVVDRHLAVVAARNGQLNACSDVLPTRARARADAVDALRAAGAPLPSLAGVPFAVKNLFDVKGLPTRAGSRINRDRPPADDDAPLVRRLEAAGAVLIAATHMGEYAYDFTGRNAHDGDARNPHDLTRMTGGSSSGSAAAVAGGLVPLSLGSDTNGSIRVPASLCGLFGLKPTYGGLTRAHTFPFVASLDHLGPLARSTLDLALAFDAMAGPDPDDPVCNPLMPRPLVPELAKGLAGLRIARAGGYYAANGTPDAHAAAGKVADALSAAETVEFPEAGRARAAAFVITMIEGAALHAGRLRERADDFDPEVRDRLLAGLMLPGQWYVRAQKFRRWYRTETLKLFERHDAIIAPATPTTAPLISQKTFVLDGVELPVRANMGVYTQPISFIGLPVATVPLTAASGLPIGVQVISAPGREDVALRISHALEQAGVARLRVAAG
jgi:aspartyl-tRNA(Asn)/glutamyl-tRNA(Gln) amidotransferase subunit A